MNSSLAPFQIAMLAAGIVLFVVAVALIIFFAAKDRSTRPGIALIPFAILMIGFPSVKNFKGFGFELSVAVQLAEEKARALEENPNDQAARKELDETIRKLERNVTPENASPRTAETIAQAHAALGNPDQALQWANVAVRKAPDSEAARTVMERAKITKTLPADLSQPLTPEARSNLTSAVSELNKQQDLTPATRVTLAKAQLALGQTNAAATNMHRALRENANLSVNPQLRVLLNSKAGEHPR